MACKIPTDISKSKSVRKILESWEKLHAFPLRLIDGILNEQ
jgi:hypothetical protein